MHGKPPMRNTRFRNRVLSTRQIPAQSEAQNINRQQCLMKTRTMTRRPFYGISSYISTVVFARFFEGLGSLHAGRVIRARYLFPIYFYCLFPKLFLMAPTERRRLKNTITDSKMCTPLKPLFDHPTLCFYRGVFKRD